VHRALVRLDVFGDFVEVLAERGDLLSSRAQLFHGALYVVPELGVVHQAPDRSVPACDHAAGLCEVARGLLEVVRELLVGEGVGSESQVVRCPFGFGQRALSQRHDAATDRDWNRFVWIPFRVFVGADADLDEAVAEQALASDRGKARLRILSFDDQPELAADQMGRLVDDAEVDLDTTGLSDDDFGDRADVHTRHADRVALL